MEVPRLPSGNNCNYAAVRIIAKTALKCKLAASNLFEGDKLLPLKGSKICVLVDAGEKMQDNFTNL